MNREQRRLAARQKGHGQTHADVLAKRRIGQATLKMAMEDEAVALAADIKCQQKLTLVEKPVSYVADFVYERDGRQVVEDAKGFKDPSSAAYAKFVLKRKMMLERFNIRVVEV